MTAHRHLLRALALTLALGLAGCNGCGSTPASTDGPPPSACPTACGAQDYCCHKTLQCEKVKYNCKNLQSCPPGQELVYPAGPTMDEATCEPLPLTCTCKDGPALKPGIIGRFSSLTAASGTLYASGYENDFGDLVLVRAQASALEAPSSEIVDGVPNKPATKAPGSWRGGVEDPGDDVGQDTSIRLVGSEPAIAYRDLTNRALKFALRAGGGWSPHVVDSPKGAKEVVGRYTSLLVDGGKPLIAYAALNVPGTGGVFKSELRWAEARSAAPTSAADWTVTVIESRTMSCQNLCATTEVCVLKADGSSACQAKGTAACTPACTATQACLGGVCQTILPDTKYVDIPTASGLWASVVKTSAGPLVVYYDRVAGRLRAASRSAATWKTAVLAGAGTDDLGAFCSATTDGGASAHVAYQDALKLTLNYLQVDGATLAASAKEVIDDGLRSDGPHPVGADATILVDGGTVRVVYQDAQKSDLLGAKRGGAGSWTPKDPADADLGRLIKGGPRAYGFYSALVADGGVVYGSTFFYDAQGTPKGGLAFYKLP